MLKQRIEQDLKTALLAGDTTQVSVLRSLKSAITYAEIARGVKHGEGFNDEEVVEVLARESKKRQESADIFGKNDRKDRASQELREKEVIDKYLPSMVSENDLTVLVDRLVNQLDEPNMQQIGKVITQVKQETQGRVDGATVARLVKERLQKQ